MAFKSKHAKRNKIQWLPIHTHTPYTVLLITHKLYEWSKRTIAAAAAAAAAAERDEAKHAVMHLLLLLMPFQVQIGGVSNDMIAIQVKSIVVIIYIAEFCDAQKTPGWICVYG